MVTVETMTTINTQKLAEISNLQQHSVCSDTRQVVPCPVWFREERLTVCVGRLSIGSYCYDSGI